MQIRRQAQNFQDVNYNFQLIDRLLRGHGLDGEHIRVIPGEKVEGLQELVDEVKGEFGNLGGLAYSDAVQKAQLGTTIIAGGYIVTGMIDASRIDTGHLNADRIDARTISTDKIEIGGVTYDNLADYAVGEDKVGKDAISARTIQADAVVADKILAGAVTTAKIEAGAVQADKIESGSIETYHISAEGVDAGIITSGGFPDDRVESASAWHAKLDDGDVGNMAYYEKVKSAMEDETIIVGGYIDTSFLTADNIQTGTLSADYIYGGTLSGVTVSVDTNAYIGSKLYLKSDSFNDGIFFSDYGEIYVDPAGGRLVVSGQYGEQIGGVGNSVHIESDIYTLDAGSESRSINQFTMPYWTANMCYIDLHSTGVTVRDSGGNNVGTISFD